MNQRAEHQTNEPPDEQTTAENAAAAPPTQQRTMTSHSKLYYDKDTASLPSHRKLCMRRGMSTGLAVYVCSRYRDAASRPAQPALEVLAEEQPKLSKAVQVRYNEGTTYKSRRHTKAYEGVRRQPAYEGIRRHTKAARIRRHTNEGIRRNTKAYKYEGIRIVTMKARHTNRYISAAYKRTCTVCSPSITTCTAAINRASGSPQPCAQHSCGVLKHPRFSTTLVASTGDCWPAKEDGT